MNSKKHLWFDFAFVIVYALAYIFFIISLYKGVEWSAGIIISSIIIFVCLIISIVRPLISKSIIKLFDWIEILANIVGAIILIIVFASASESNVKDAAIQVSAASIGGLLTLYGVGITIKYNQIQRKEDELKRVRPLFSYNMLRKEPVFDATISKICLSSSLEGDDCACEAIVEIENSNLSAFEIKHFFHDGKWVEAEGNKVVLPSAKCLIDFRFDDNPNLLFLEVEDILKNKYYYHLHVLYLGAKTSSNKLFHTIREINEIQFEDIEKLIKTNSHEQSRK